MNETIAAYTSLNDDLRTKTDDPAAFLASSWFLDFETPSVAEFVAKNSAGEDERERAVSLFYAVRAGIPRCLL